jgi:hypothetical protein
MVRILASLVVALRLLTRLAQGAVVIDWVTVGAPGNAKDTQVMNNGTSGYGCVPYADRIGKHEITAGQYVEFLNAVAATDTNGLYHRAMREQAYGCKIERRGAPGSYT